MDKSINLYVRMYVCTSVCIHVYVCMYVCMCMCIGASLELVLDPYHVASSRRHNTAGCLAQEAENLPETTYSVRGVGDLPCPPNLALGSGRTAAAGLGTCCRSVGSWKIGTWSLCVSVDAWGVRSTEQGLALNQTGGCSGNGHVGSAEACETWE